MPRRLTGWVLTAMLIGIVPGTALGGVRPFGEEDLNIEAAVPSLADSGKGYIDCLEVVIAREPLAVRGGKVLLLQDGRLVFPRPGMTLKEIDEAIQRGGGIVIEKPDERLLDELVRTGRVLDPSKRTWPSLPTDELLPTGDKPVDLIGAACGTPEGMTFLIPFARGSRPAAAAM